MRMFLTNCIARYARSASQPSRTDAEDLTEATEGSKSEAEEDNDGTLLGGPETPTETRSLNASLYRKDKGGAEGDKKRRRVTKEKKEETEEAEFERPRVRYTDLGGIEGVLQDVRELIEYPLTHPEIYSHLGKSPLLRQFLWPDEQPQHGVRCGASTWHSLTRPSRLWENPAGHGNCRGARSVLP